MSRSSPPLPAVVIKEQEGGEREDGVDALVLIIGEPIEEEDGGTEIERQEQHGGGVVVGMPPRQPPEQQERQGYRRQGDEREPQVQPFQPYEEHHFQRREVGVPVLVGIAAVQVQPCHLAVVPQIGSVRGHERQMRHEAH